MNSLMPSLNQDSSLIPENCRIAVSHYYLLWHRIWVMLAKIKVLINSLRPRPSRRRFADAIFKCIFENENEWISPRILMKFVPKVRIDNIPSLVQIMAWRRPGDKSLSEPMMDSLLTHKCVTRPQWVKDIILAMWSCQYDILIRITFWFTKLTG